MVCIVQRQTRLRIPLLLALTLIPASVIVLALPAAQANHGDEGNSKYFWDRSTVSGHRNLLDCKPWPNNDHCKIKFEIDSSVVRIGLSEATVKSETTRAVNTINSVTDYIGMKRVTSSDNEIRGEYSTMMHTARYDFERHCTGLFGICPFDHGKDNHISDFKIFLNTNRNVAVFGTEERCNSRNTLVTIYDVERTILHELWHIMGTEHSGERTSVVAYNGNSCPQADTPNAHDKAVLKAKYPRGVR